MGDFRVEIKATGGHGCDRAAKNGDPVKVCNSPTCPDCDVARLMQKWAHAGMLRSASFTHWPGQDSEIVDEYNPTSGIAVRRGSF